jgi:hypothetical protein
MVIIRFFRQFLLNYCTSLNEYNSDVYTRAKVDSALKLCSSQKKTPEEGWFGDDVLLGETSGSQDDSSFNFAEAAAAKVDGEAKVHEAQFGI